MFTGGEGLGNFARKGGKGPRGFREKMSGTGKGKEGEESPQAQAQGVKDEVCGTKLAAGSLFPDFAKLGSLGVRGL